MVGEARGNSAGADAFDAKRYRLTVADVGQKLIDLTAQYRVLGKLTEDLSVPPHPVVGKAGLGSCRQLKHRCRRPVSLPSLHRKTTVFWIGNDRKTRRRIEDR